MRASAGAPPDAVFTKGQNWTFPPLHPEKIRQQHYQHVIAYLRHHLHYADILRIDHVMGLHRLFCIPNTMEPNQGVYLRYRAEELYAILAIESQRSKTLLVGEDLGTVPQYVRPAMKNHGLYRMYIMHYELATNPENKPTAVNSNLVASLNTHDIPPFAAFWQGIDIKERSRLGILDHQGAKKEARNYEDMKRGLITFLLKNGWLKKGYTDITSILQACLSFLAASPARIVLANLEDLWLETKPQNIPSTKTEYPNWQRKMQYSLEEFCQIPQVLATLQIINKLRKKVTNDEKA
jgi:4-alpha-glucanotransferase